MNIQEAIKLQEQHPDKYHRGFVYEGLLHGSRLTYCPVIRREVGVRRKCEKCERLVAWHVTIICKKDEQKTPPKNDT